MKKKILTVFFLICIPLLLKAQNTCGTAQPFCTSTNYTFPASTNTPPPSGANFGCLGTQPNPAFYF